MATPVAPSNAAPVTDAGKGAKHQIVRMPLGVSQTPNYFNVVPVASQLKGGVTGLAYSETVSAQGGTTPYSFAVSSGAVPTGTSLNSSSGVISGTPTTVATYSFTITVTDASSFTGSTPFSIGILAPSLAGANAGYTA